MKGSLMDVSLVAKLAFITLWCIPFAILFLVLRARKKTRLAKYTNTCHEYLESLKEKNLFLREANELLIGNAALFCAISDTTRDSLADAQSKLFETMSNLECILVQHPEQWNQQMYNDAVKYFRELCGYQGAREHLSRVKGLISEYTAKRSRLDAMPAMLSQSIAEMDAVLALKPSETTQKMLIAVKAARDVWVDAYHAHKGLGVAYPRKQNLQEFERILTPVLSQLTTLQETHRKENPAV